MPVYSYIIALSMISCNFNGNYSLITYRAFTSVIATRIVGSYVYIATMGKCKMK